MPPRVRASQPQLLEISHALLESFSEPELVELLGQLHQHYHRLTARSDSLDENARRIVEAAERQDWLIPLLERASALRPRSQLWQFYRRLTEGSRDHILVFISYAGDDGRELADRLKGHLSILPVTVTPWENDGSGADPAARRSADHWLDVANVVLLLLTATGGVDDWPHRHALDRARLTNREVIALRADPEVEAPPVSTIDMTGWAARQEGATGWEELRQRLDRTASPEGLLSPLRAREARFERLRNDDEAAQPVVDAALRAVRHRIDRQQRRLADPVAARLEAAEETMALRDEQAAGRPADATSRVRTYGEPPELPTTFRNRDAELRSAEWQLQHTEVRVTALIGPVGVGKTGVTSRLWRRIVDGDSPVAADGVVYLPVLGYLPITAMSLLTALVRVAPEAGVRDLEESLRLPTPLREKADDVLNGLAGTTVVVVIDNAEGLLDDPGDVRDRELRDLVHYLARRVDHGVRLVLVTTRSPDRLLRELPEAAVPLRAFEGLREDHAYEVLCTLDESGAFHLDDATSHQITWLHRLTRGNPRALELAYAILRENPDKRLGWLLDQLAEVGDGDVVGALFDRLFRDLDREMQRVVQALAVFARPVTPAAVDEILQPYVDPPRSRDLLVLLHEQRLVRLESKGYYLPHRPDADCALSRIPEGSAEDRTSTPRRFTQAALFHLAAAHFHGERKDRRKVLRLQDLDADFAEADLRIRGREYEPAQDLIEKLDDELLRPWGHSDAIMPLLEEMGSGLVGDRYRQIRRISRLAEAHLQRERLDRADEYLVEAMALTRLFREADARVRLHMQFAAAHFDAGEISDALHRYRRSLRLNHVYLVPRWYADALRGIAECHGRMGRFRHALRVDRAGLAMLRLSRRPDDNAAGLRLWLSAGWVHAQIGDRGAARRLVNAALDGARAGQQRLIEGRCLVLLAELLIAEGAGRKAIDVAAEAAETGLRAGNGSLCRAAREVRTLACLAIDDVAEAATSVSLPGRPSGDPLGQALHGIVAFRQGRSADARAMFHSVAERVAALRGSEPRDFQLLDTHGIVLTGLAVTDKDRRADHADAAVAAFQQARSRSAGGHGAVLRVLQLLHQFADDTDPEVMDRARIAASGATGNPPATR